jgi:hypothetical protein
MHYKLVSQAYGWAPHLVNTHEVPMRLLVDDEDGGETYVQYVGGYVTGMELLDVEDVTPRLWSAVALGIATQLEAEMRRGRVEFGQTEDEQITMLQVPVDVRAADKLARSGAAMPELVEGAVVYEFDVPELQQSSA